MIKAFFKKIRDKKWYHQRFDGSPMYIYVIADAECRKERRKPAGTEARMRVCYFQDEKADWYLDMADVRRGAHAVVNVASKDRRVSTKLLSAWKKDEKAFDHFFEKFLEIDLRSLSDKALFVLYEKFYALSVRRFTSSAIIDHFALGTDEYIASLIKKEVGAQLKVSDFTSIFSRATAPVHQSFINTAEIELLRIALLMRARQTQALAQYQKKYFWIHNNYTHAYVLGVQHFRKEIARVRASNVDIKKKYTQVRTTPTHNAREKKKLFKQYHFSPFVKTLLKISEDFTWWQDERKRATYLHIHMGTQILGEMARRRKISPFLTKFLVPPEVKEWFFHAAISQAELEKRTKGCAYIVRDNGFRIAIGIEVVRMKRAMFPEKKLDVINDVRGLSASLGKTTGIARVVRSVTEVNKVGNGDILIAVMTRPDYIMGMKRAAAIVTDEGGITCHAAIVSRELNIPCIIGTKIATSAFRDGDLLEVNANHGVVKLLKR